MLKKLLSVFLFLLVAACGSDETGRGEADSASGPEAAAQVDHGEPVSGGRIVEAELGDATNLIPALSTDSGSHEIATHVYTQLMRYDENIELKPWAAESYEVLDGGRRLRFKIRKDIEWTDGVPLTARDVEFTYRMMIDPDTPTAYAEDWKQIEEFRLTGDYSFEVTYDEVFARSLITWAADIMPRHLLEGENLMDTKYSRKPVGAGAYVLKEWDAGNRIVLQANPDHFRGRPKLDQVVYRIIPDQSTQFMELKSGNLDIMSLTPKQYLYQTTGRDWKQNYNKFKYLSFSYTYLGYNLRHPILGDKTVRQALAHAVDRREIIKGVLLGLGRLTIGPYKPGTWVYNDKIDDYPYDPSKAQAMLAEAGWTDSDGDGVLDRDGTPFAFTIITNQGNDQRIKTATIIQQRLADIGIEVEIRSIEWASFINEFIDKGRYDACVLSWNILQDPDIADVWHSTKMAPQGLNFMYYANPEADRLLEQGRHTLDQAERKKIYDRLQHVLHEDQPYMFLYVPMALPVVQARFQGIEPAPAGIGHNFYEWWVPESRQRFSREP
jgi:peptide/nickel transport system substrate-binding protein